MGNYLQYHRTPYCSWCHLPRRTCSSRAGLGVIGDGPQLGVGCLLTGAGDGEAVFLPVIAASLAAISARFCAIRAALDSCMGIYEYTE